MIYKFTRNFDASMLKTVILEHDFPELSAFSVKINADGSIGEDNIEIGFDINLTALQEQDLVDIMAAPTLQPITVENELTIKRQKEGFELYQWMYADLSLHQTFPTVDSSIAGYDTLIKIRCMLKDGSGKTALRYLIKTIQPMGLFPADQLERFRLAMRDYCYKYRVAAYEPLTPAQYDAVLDAIETAPSI